MKLFSIGRTLLFGVCIFCFQAASSAQVDGTWIFTSQTPLGTDIARIELDESGQSLTGRYFGLLGQNRVIRGTRTGDQISISITGQLPPDGTTLEATLTGTLGTTSGSGRLSTGSSPLGTWTAERPGTEDLEPHAEVAVDLRTEQPARSRTIKRGSLPAPNLQALTLTSASKLVSRPPGTMPKAPDGFQVSVYAEGFNYPRKLQTAPNGDIFLAESRLGEIKVLHGITVEGKAGSVSTFASGFRQPFGIAFYPPGLEPRFVYIANTDSVVRIPYRNGDLSARGQAELIIPDLPTGLGVVGGGHWTRDVAFTNDGQTLYVSVGSFSNSDDTDNNPREARRANVLEYSPEGQF